MVSRQLGEFVWDLCSIFVNVYHDFSNTASRRKVLSFGSTSTRFCHSGVCREDNLYVFGKKDSHVQDESINYSKCLTTFHLKVVMMEECGWMILLGERNEEWAPLSLPFRIRFGNIFLVCSHAFAVLDLSST